VVVDDEAEARAALRGLSIEPRTDGLALDRADPGERPKGGWSRLGGGQVPLRDLDVIWDDRAQ
jgi:hypothetical protein